MGEFEQPAKGDSFVTSEPPTREEAFEAHLEGASGPLENVTRRHLPEDIELKTGELQSQLEGLSSVDIVEVIKEGVDILFQRNMKILGVKNKEALEKESSYSGPPLSTFELDENFYASIQPEQNNRANLASIANLTLELELPSDDAGVPKTEK